MKFFLLCLLSLFFFLAVFAQSSNLNETPHVFYRNGKTILQSVVNGKSVVDTVDAQNKTVVKVKFAQHPEWDFSVPLKKTLAIEPSVAKGADKMLFISDVEGEFTGFRALLLANGVIDQKYNWKFGTGKLIICGDLFDRGKEVTEVLWLLYKLEQDAKAAGGYVHTILGNHDIMNLSGDIRYVDPRYLEMAKIVGLTYTDFFAADTELGRWLRTKNIIEKIGDNLCAHAGIAPQINTLAMPIAQINDKCRPYYDKAKRLASVGEADPTIASFFNSKTSLFWYRGYFVEPKATEEEVNATLSIFGVKRIVVGHTIVPGNVGFYYNGKVLGLDVNQHAGKHEAALFEKGVWYKIDDKGLKTELKNND
ncbi:metallophosphoesterase [Pedobacter sp. Hv1]|uniref:metallophosphoesterase n=1 Tax=Pedobacter sp. Hv1 TaxID=1740090 RepID=UPI0006D8A10C|nr:metallophosphoesterase [Pedobacter sp. Hv1]KQC00134.1 hypothetical protein AQF98_13910 [Pedobacter sp. Hv1]